LEVLLVTRKFPPPDDQGAVSNLLWDTANELVSRGIHTRVLTTGSSEAKESPRKGLTVLRVPSSKVSNTQMLHLSREIGGSVDVIHLHDVLPMGIGLLWSLSRWKVPKFWTLHNLSVLCRNSVLWPPASWTRDRPVEGSSPLCYVGSDPNCRRCFGHSPKESLSYVRFVATKMLLRRIASRFKIIVPSQAAGKVLQEAWGIRPTVIPNGTRFPPGEPPGLEQGDAAVSFSGRIVPEKGLDLLVKAVSQLSSRRGRPPIPILVVGDGRKEYVRRLRDLAAEAGVTLHLTGWVERKRVLENVHNSWGLVVPSRGFEMFGMAPLDGASTGVPVAVSDAGGLAELGKRGEAPLVFRRDDLSSLVQALDELLFDDKQRRRRGLLFRKVASHRFAVSKHVDRLLKLYEQAA